MTLGYNATYNVFVFTHKNSRGFNCDLTKGCAIVIVLQLRNPQKEFVFATVKNSAVSMYFKRQVELSTMFRTMETNNLDTPEQAIAAIKNE